MATIKGKWCLAPTTSPLGLPPAGEYNVNFKTIRPEVEYTGMVITNVMSANSYKKADGTLTTFYQMVNWVDWSYSVIDFGDEEQEVDEVLYDWLIGTAQQITDTSISGTWYINTMVYIDGMINLPTFTSNGAQFIHIDITKFDSGDTFLYYIDELAVNVVNVCSNYTWVDEQYRFLDFGTDEQELNAYEYAWLTRVAFQTTNVQGVWNFNDALTAPTRPVNWVSPDGLLPFTSNGNSFGSFHINLQSDESGSLFYAAYDEATGAYSNSVKVYEAPTGWVDENYRTIDFGSEPKIVSMSFYTWLVENTSNQTKQKLYTEFYIKNIAYKIREKTKSTIGYKISEMPGGVEAVYQAGVAKGWADRDKEDKMSQLIDRTITEITEEDLAGVTQIGDGTFYNCKSLKAITIPNSVTKLGSSSFYQCTSLESIVIPDSVSFFNVSVFSGCSALKNVILPKNLSMLPDSAFYSCKALENITLPEKLTGMGSSFSGCSSLKSITIPSKVTSFGYGTFQNCTSLASVTIESNVVTTFTNYLFNNCTSLRSITIPSSVTTIQSNALRIGSATSKATITFLRTTPPTITTTTFDATKLEKIIVPAGCSDAYKAATNWSNFADYIEEAQ
jgi:deoxycytidine triphosphate deaminase